MSYILEALKKAQAERQLGNAPTIHAPQAVPVVTAAGVNRTRLYVGAGAAVLVAVVAGALLVRRPASAPVPAPVSTQPSASVSTQPSAPVAAMAAAAGTARVPDTLNVSAPPVSAVAAVPAPARVATPAAATLPATAQVQAQGQTQLQAQVRAPVVATAPATAATTMGAGAPAPVPARASDDSLPYLQQLPEAQQRDIPRVAFGGYMYSANPADRLLIVDKALRHEGEEVAPGLLLEKLLPRAAVMNYRGTRYRVAY